jgi:hypothetical protein
VGKMKVWLGNGVVLLVLDLQVSFIQTEAVAATHGLAQLGMMHTSCRRRMLLSWHQSALCSIGTDRSAIR